MNILMKLNTWHYLSKVKQLPTTLNTKFHSTYTSVTPPPPPLPPSTKFLKCMRRDEISVSV